MVGGPHWAAVQPLHHHYAGMMSSQCPLPGMVWAELDRFQDTALLLKDCYTSMEGTHVWGDAATDGTVNCLQVSFQLQRKSKWRLTNQIMQW